MSASALDQLRDRTVIEVATAGGLRIGRGNPPSLAPCPCCSAERRGDGDGRGPVGLRRDLLGWRCFVCHGVGDALRLAAILATGSATPPDWRDVLAWGAERGLCDAPGATSTRRRPLPPPPPAAIRAPARPPAGEVAELWQRCPHVTDDVEVSAWLRGRAIKPEIVTALDLCRALPTTGPLPAWCRYVGRSWRDSTHRIVFPMFSATGHMESLHARALSPGWWLEGDVADKARSKHKAASPAGFEVGGLVMADPLGLVMLRQEMSCDAEWVRRCGVVVTEGATDFLSWATEPGVENLDGRRARCELPAVVGIIAGSWCADVATRVPSGAEVTIATDADGEGERYSEKVAATLERCRLTRWIP